LIKTLFQPVEAPSLALFLDLQQEY